ncbi:MAG: tetratricopeptide repeat protein [Spirochaetes bacterium]|nr:tetratricopeptide repeat protein [Spirochaetota bacterium]MBN2772480.1 tetratricopeptide repeat protein [Spirochaetota bacterium]
MSELKQYHYKSRSQRIIALSVAFLVNFAVGMAITMVFIDAKTVFFYRSVFNNVVIYMLFFHFLGIIAGSQIFKRLKQSRWFFCGALLLFTLVFITLFSVKYFLNDYYRHLIIAYIEHTPFLVLVVSAVPFAGGVINNYILKVVCGKFFDEKKSGHFFVMHMLLGLIAGGVWFSAVQLDFLPGFLLFMPFLPLVALAFIFKLEYSPDPFFAREVKYSSEIKKTDTAVEKKEDLVFNYLNFLYIVIYTILGFFTFIRFYNDLLYIKLFFLSVIFIFLALGFMLSFILKSRYWHIYSEMYYPFFFLFFFIMLNRFSGQLPFYYGALFIIPLAFCFGMTLYHTTQFIIGRYDQIHAYRILRFGIFLIPIPVIIALSFVVFSNRLFFVFFYFVAALNIVLPGLHLAQRSDNEYRKGLYLLLFIIVVPAFIMTHLYFKISLDSALYVTYTRNYDAVYSFNSNSDYFDVNSDILFNDKRVMKISDQFIRDLRRSVLSLTLFTDNNRDGVLFIDGNRKFFDNNVYEIFDNGECLDYMLDSQVDYNSTPVSGRKSMVTFKSDIFTFFKNRDRRYDAIVDIPNIYDQTHNSIRFSETYYEVVKRYLEGKSLFFQLIQPESASSCLVNSAVSGFKKSFKHHIVFYFGENLVIAGSNESDFAINREGLERINYQISSSKKNRSLFYRDVHCLSYILDSSLPETKKVPQKIDYLSSPFMGDCNDVFSESGMLRYFDSIHDKFLSLKFDDDSMDLKKTLAVILEDNRDILTLLKKSENAALKGDFKEEAEFLSSLRKAGEYDYDIRHYVEGLLTVKELTFVRAATELEEGRNWTEAKDIYESILILNDSNFEAHYRLGLIYITLQQLDKAFVHFDRALRLEPNNPQVLYQVGVLMYMVGEYRYALEYLRRAINYNLQHAMVFLYSGLANESLGKYRDARQDYEKALLADPNNPDIKASLSRIENRIESSVIDYSLPERRNQNEVEEGEYIPLPINKNAIDKRLSEDELRFFTPRDKSEGSKYGDKYAEPPGAEKTEAPEPGSSFFDLFGG